MKKLLHAFLILVLGLAPLASAQVTAVVTNQPLFALYDLDATTDISCSYGPEVRVGGTATTSGSSTTTTSSTAAFSAVIVGDIIWASVSGVKTGRVVTARASASSITVDLAWTLPSGGVSITKQSVTCGASSGWVKVNDASRTTVTIDLAQVSLGSGGVGFKIEGRYSPVSTSAATNLWPGDASADAHCDSGTYASGYCVLTAADAITVHGFGVAPLEIRLVTYLTGTDDGSDTGADAEKINATLQVVR